MLLKGIFDTHFKWSFASQIHNFIQNVGSLTIVNFVDVTYIYVCMCVYAYVYMNNLKLFM